VTFRVTGAVCADADRGITLSAHAEVADDRMADALTEPLLFFLDICVLFSSVKASQFQHCL
jgi:hypothetical protein